MPTTLLSTRKNLNIGTWNVRTMYEAGKTAQVAAEMRRFNLALLGLCETRWTQSGQLRLTTGEIILYSGHEEDDAPHSYWGRRHREHLLAGKPEDRGA